MSPLATRIDGPIAVIGDVHGQADQLRALLDRLRASGELQPRWLVFIGDFVDRGEDPKAALDIVTGLFAEHPRTTAVAGNHDLAMAASLEWVEVPEYAGWADDWLQLYESETTFASYGVPFGDLARLAEEVPPSHREFLAALPWCVEHPDYLFIHAGLDPHTPTEMQLHILRQKDLSLARPKWLCSKSLVQADVPADCPATVVSGHVFVPDVEFDRRRILLDTTGGRGGELSCVLLPENHVVTPSGVDTSHEARPWWRLW